MGKTDQSDVFDTDNVTGITIIETMEDMDLYSAIQIKEHFNNLHNAGKKRFIIDLKNTRYLDSSGLGVLIHMHTTAVKDKSIIIRFVNIAEAVFKVLKLTHLDNMFQIAPDIDTAIKEIQLQQSGGTAGSSSKTVTEEVTLDNDEELSRPQINETKLNNIEEDHPEDEEYIDEEHKDYVAEEDEDEEVEMFMDVEKIIEEDEDLEIGEYIKDKTQKQKALAAANIPDQKEIKIDIKQIIVNGDNPLFSKTDLKYRKFHISIGKIQKAIDFIMQDTYLDPDEQEQLEHQLYEILKNAVKHGNKSNWWKAVKVWYTIKLKEARFIIEDRGKGFRELEQWNELFRQRAICYHNRDREGLKKYRSFRTEHSDKSDRGTALFSAIEYWNGGIIFNDKRNSIAVKVVFGK